MSGARARVLVLLLIVSPLISVNPQTSDLSSISESIDVESNAGTFENPVQKTHIMQVNLPFVENVGQLNNDDIRYVTNTFGGSIFVLKNGTLTYALTEVHESGQANKNPFSTSIGSSNDVQRLSFTESFVTTNTFKPMGEKMDDAVINSFIGSPETWRSNIPAYDVIRIASVWDGIDISLKSADSNFEKLFKVSPGADPNDIRLSFKGIDRLSVNDNGQLVLWTDHGNVTMTKPRGYQEIGGEIRSVDIAYKIVKSNASPAYGFEIIDEAYDNSYDLVIDPLLASSFIGGSDEDFLNAIAVDEDSDVYVMGLTFSTDFPIELGYDITDNPDADVFVSKFDSDLEQLIASTYLGGDGEDHGFAMTVASGEVILAGDTDSSDFPTTIGSFSEDFSGGTSDIFVTKLTDDLGTLSRSTYLGGSGLDTSGFSIATDETGNIIISGDTSSTDYPTSIGAFDTTHNNLRDIVVSKLDSNLDLVSSTFLGGSDPDFSTAVILDSNGDILVTGYSFSDNFPTTPAAYNRNNSGLADSIVSKLSPDLEQLFASTYIGGDDDDLAQFIALDSLDNIYITGESESGDFPTTTGAFDSTNSDLSNDVFLSKLDRDLEVLSASTYLGDLGSDGGYTVIVDDSDSFVYVGGYGSNEYPANVNYNGGIDDAIVSKLDASDFSTLEASSFLGGVNSDYITSMAMSPSGTSLYLAGITLSSDFPSTNSAFDVTLDGTRDGFVAKMTTDLEARPTGSVSINDDDEYTSSTEITLELSCSDNSACDRMIVSVDGEFDDEISEPIQSSLDVTLTDGDGIRTVHVIFVDDVGNESDEISDTIILDTSPPIAPTIDFPEENDIFTFPPSIEGSVVTNFVLQWGASGFDEGEFDNSNDIAIDSDGNVYVADTGNDRIQKFDSDGNFLLQWGSPGFDDGEFGSPVGIAVDINDDVYVADNWREDIQKFSSTGDFIMSWQEENLSNPQGVGADDFGYIYVADRGNERIVKFDSDGDLITQWGVLASVDENFDPLDVDVGPDGSVYVADTSNYRIQRFTDEGEFLGTWGSNGFSDGEFSFVSGVAVDIEGNVYTADDVASRIQKFDSDGDFITKWGQFGSSESDLDDPNRIAVDPLGNVYVHDRGDDFFPKVVKFEANQGDPVIEVYDSGSLIGTVDDPPLAGFWFTEPFLQPGSHHISARVIDAAGNPSALSDVLTFEIEDNYVPAAPVITDPADGTSTNDTSPTISGTLPATFITKWGSTGTGNGEFDGPHFITTDSEGNLYVSDTENNRVQKFDNNGNFLAIIGSPGAGDGQMFSPYGLAVDSDDNLYVAEFNNDRIQKFDNNGVFVTKWGSAGSGDGQFRPIGLAIDSEDHVYVGDIENNRIQKFDSDGNFITKWGSPGTENSEFDQPWGLATDSENNVYVADGFNDRIQKFDSDGNFLLQWGSPGFDDGEFGGVVGVTVDVLDSVFVTDGTMRVQKFSTDGTFITNWGELGSEDDQFIGIGGIVSDLLGYIYVVESDPDQVKKFEAPLSNSTVQVFDGIALLGNTSSSLSGSGAWSFTPSSPLAAGDHDITAKALDFASNISSPSETVTITVDATTPTTTATPEGGTFSDAQSVSLSSDEASATIYYTTDGTTPTTLDNVYSGPIDVNAYTELKFFARDLAGNRESVKTEEYVFTATSIESATGDDVGFATSTGSLGSIEAIDEEDLPLEGKPDSTFPFGFLSWEVTGLPLGGAVTITLTFSENIAGGAEYWKVIDDTWVDASSLLGSNDGDNILILTVTDGGFGDADGLVNGQVQDPGGIGEPPKGTMTIRIEDTDGELLPDARISVDPDPRTGVNEALEVQDNCCFDSSASDGIILIEDVLYDTYTVEVITTPDGYEGLTGQSTITVHATDTDPSSTFRFKLEDEDLEEPSEVQGPGMSEDQFDSFVDNGASVDGEEINSTDDLPSAFIVPEDQRDDIGEDKPVDPATVTFEEPAQPDSTAGELFDNYDIPTYPGPPEDVSEDAIYAVPSFVIPHEGSDDNSFVLTPIIDQLFAGIGLVLTQDQITDSGNAQLVQVEMELSENGDDIGFSFGITDELPEGFDSPPDLDVVPLFLDVDFIGDTDFSDPDAFTESPEITILAKRSLETDDNDPVRRFSDQCPALRLYLLNEDTDEWERLDDPERFDDIDTDDMCGYLVHTDHFSKFGIGGVKGGVITGDSVVGNKGGGGGGGGGGSPSVNVKRIVTFDQAHFEINPLTRMEVLGFQYLDSSGNRVISEAREGNITISSTVTNRQKVSQTYTFIVQILDSNGYVINIDWSTGTLASGETATISNALYVENAGVYKIHTFVWNSLADLPAPLSPHYQKSIRISE